MEDDIVLRKTMDLDLIYPGSKHRASILSVGLGCLRKTNVDLIYLDSKRRALILSMDLAVLERQRWI